MEQYFTILFQRDLVKLKEELEAFRDENNIWKNAPGVRNSAGNLTLHLLGNLNHFVGALLGNTGYIRNRELEFSASDISRQQLVSDIDTTAIMVQKILDALTPEQLAAIYPFEVFGVHSTAFYLTHFFGHLNYHLGQINYLRRILEA